MTPKGRKEVKNIQYKRQTDYREKKTIKVYYVHLLQPHK